MDVFILMLLISALIAGFFFYLLIRSVGGGQFEDLDDAAWRILDEDEDDAVPRSEDKREE